MNPWIAGIGTALPTHRIAQAEAAELAKRYTCRTEAEERLFVALYRRAGVKTRFSTVLDASDGPLEGRQSFFGSVPPTTRERMVKFEAEAGSLAVDAARAALRDAGLDAERVTHLVTVSCSGFYAPGFDVTLIKQLPLRRSTARTQVGFMGCHGALNGLRVARALIQADPRACVLLCAVELCGLHHQYDWNPDQIVANALFADGAAALVAVGGERSGSNGYIVTANGSTVFDDSEEAMSWRIGDRGFTMTLSPLIPELISRHVGPWLEQWLGEHGLTIDAVGSWAVHPGGPRILTAFGESTGLGRSALAASFDVLAEHGNMSSPTVLFILDRLRRGGLPRPCVALAFGPGLAVEAAILE